MSPLHGNQQKILDYLLGKTHGATLGELSQFLEITKTAVKEHIIRLEGMGYIFFSDLKEGVGRPKRYYKLSPEGQEVFPKQYAWLSNQLLEFLSETMGKTKTENLMRQLADKIALSFKERFSNSTGNKIKILESIMNELGYRVVARQSDLRKTGIIEASNCVYHSVAREHPELCQFDIQFIKTSLNAEVELDSCIAKGGSVCRFCIKKKK